MRDLTSAGSATAARAAVQERLTPLVTETIRVFLARVRAAAFDALDAPVLLASAAPFNLNAVTGLWATASLDLMTQISHATGSPVNPARLTRYQRALLGRLASNPLVGDAYQSVTDVLTESVNSSWPRSRTEATLREALAPNTATLTRTADGLTESGRTWQSVADSIARTEATSAFGNATLNDLAAAGHKTARWVSHHDHKVRDTHLHADGQVVPIGTDFIVGGFALGWPADPKGPPGETVACRCVLIAGDTVFAGPAPAVRRHHRDRARR